MRRVVAGTLAATLALAAPAAALAQNAPPAQGGQGQYGAQSSNGQPVDQSGLAAYGQDAPPQSNDNTQFLLAGGLALGAGALIAVLATQNKSNNNNENPASP